MVSSVAISSALAIAALIAWKALVPNYKTSSKSGRDGESKSVLITGYSEGSIGAALAHAFHAHGYIVFATARRISNIPARLQDLSRIHALELNVTDQTSINRAVTDITRHVDGKGLDVLVNSAGTMLSGLKLVHVDIDQVGKQCFEVNVWGPLRMMQAFSALLVKASEKDNGNATVVNLGSIIGEIWFAYQPLYAASKAALHTISESMRLELAPFRIRVLAVVVDAVQSNLQRNQPRFHANSDSFYAPIQEKIRDFVEGVVPHSETPTEDFAEQVVRDVEMGKEGKVWRGQGVWLIWFLGTIMPTRVSDWVFSAMKGLSGLRRVREASGSGTRKAGWSEKLEKWLEVLA
ncbi:NAD(P)-binding protein [Cucurbitaria berberidis CBS 394.84]|uniref:NAD(P)-binding protein n=1 Tax=Cucurbitaria berberidis CBS 394.84 TaxID=1168544 RepID=A0A9P4GMS1_9PLEO|nr:NAD(P)-binding protein [Cucurbitaria berberidis CBS 394.84]KAF1848064.1 NAD(P)-binding protein [Cucurbitaria berberidis CBS 394.84]